jgi:hypothetical protein
VNESPDTASHVEQPASPAAAAAPEAPEGRRSREKVFWLLAATIGLFLVLLIIFLLLYSRPNTLVVRGGEETAGLRPVLAISGPGRGENPEFAKPMGGALGGDGRIYAVDTGNNRVAVFTPEGRYLFEFGGFGIAKPLAGYEATWEEGLMNYPLGIDVAEDETIYVADFRNDQIQVFDSEGTFLRRFPDPLTVVGRGASGQDGTGIAVTDVAVAGDLVFAADTYQVVVFTTEGEFVRQFGRPGSAPGEFNHLTGIDVTPEGTVLVADSNNNRIQALSAEGEFLWSVGGTPGSSAGATATADAVTPYGFGLPRSVAVMGDGTIAVLDAFDFSIVLFTRDGELIDTYGQRGGAPGQLSFPNSIEADGNRLLVSDRQNNRVQLLEVVR